MDAQQKYVSDRWYETAFGALYPIVYAHRDTMGAGREVEFAVRALDLKPRERVLDLCCGAARHLVHLLKFASDAVGYDYSNMLLGPARETLGPQGRLVRGDMRTLPFVNAFDAVVNFFTSFGYFFTREENLTVVREIARALRTGGRFFIDYVNPEYAAANLVPSSVRRQGAYEIRETRWIDDARRMNKRTVVVEGSTMIGETAESVQLFSVDAFRELLSSGGFEVLELFGDFSGQPVSSLRPRLIAVCRKASQSS